MFAVSLRGSDMAITASDIQWRLSVPSASQGDTTAQPDPNASLGLYASTTQISGTALNNLYDNISGDENAASDVEYRCIFVYNAHATLTWLGVVIWLSAEVGGGANVAIALDNIAASDIDSASAQADSVVNENTAPDAVGAFSSPTTKGTGLVIGDLGPDQVKAIWIRRTATNSAALDNDGVTLRAEGDTAA